MSTFEITQKSKFRSGGACSLRARVCLHLACKLILPPADRSGWVARCVLCAVCCVPLAAESTMSQAASSADFTLTPAVPVLKSTLVFRTLLFYFHKA